jgi:hypothetical protein
MRKKARMAAAFDSGRSRHAEGSPREPSNSIAGVAHCQAWRFIHSEAPAVANDPLRRSVPARPERGARGQQLGTASVSQLTWASVVWALFVYRHLTRGDEHALANLSSRLQRIFKANLAVRGLLAAGLGHRRRIPAADARMAAKSSHSQRTDNARRQRSPRHPLDPR